MPTTFPPNSTRFEIVAEPTFGGGLVGSSCEIMETLRARLAAEEQKLRVGNRILAVALDRRVEDVERQAQ